MMQLPKKFLLTGVGSLPFREPGPALELIWRSVPNVPHWPQLPRAGSDEGFSVQYLQALIKMGLVVAKEGLYFDTNAPEWLERLTEFYTLYLSALEGEQGVLDSFGFPPEAARGFYAFQSDLHQNGKRDAVCLKGQLSGPLTVGFQLTGPDKRACYYDPQLRDVLVKNLALHALWQVRTMQTFDLPVLIMVDEPGLYAYGASSHITLTREEIQQDLNTIYDVVKGEGAWVGTHVCAGTDWTVLFESHVDVINFDAYGYFDSMKVYAGRLRDFLAGGGVLSWGIVPTSQDILKEDAKSLFERFTGYLQELEQRGIERKLILEQSIFTPSCGTGTLSGELAEKIHQTLADFGGLLETLA